MNSGEVNNLKINKKKLILMVARMLEHVDPQVDPWSDCLILTKSHLSVTKNWRSNIRSWNSMDTICFACVIQCSPDKKFSHVRSISKIPPRTMLNYPAYKFFCVKKIPALQVHISDFYRKTSYFKCLKGITTIINLLLAKQYHSQ